MDRSELKPPIIKNGIYNISGALIRAGVGLGTAPILSRFMGLEEYGVWALISSILAFLTVVESGLSNTITVFLSKDLNNQDDLKVSQDITICLGLMLVLAVLASSFLYLTAEGTVSLFPKFNLAQKENITLALKIGSFSILFQLLQQVFIGIEQAYQEYKYLNLLKTFQFLLFGFGWIIIAKLGGSSVKLTVWQLVVSSLILIAHICVFRFLTRKQDLKIAWEGEKAIIILQYSLSMWLMTLGSVLFMRGDRIIVGSTLGAEGLGVYALVSDIAYGINFLVAQPIQPLLPFVSGLNQNSISLYALKSRIRRMVRLNSCMASWCGSFVLVFSPLIIEFIIPLSSTTRETALTCLYLLSIVTTLYSLSNIGYFTLMSNNIKFLSFLFFLSGFLTLVLIYLGSINYGLIGAILGNIAFTAMIISTFLSANKFGLDYKETFYSILIPIFPFLLICLFKYLLSATHIFFSCLLLFQSIVSGIWFFYYERGRI
jgi:O-antigen/teichoic acid export membrane protein